MSKEREIGNWVTPEIGEKLRRLRSTLYWQEKRKRKSRTRRWKNLRGTFAIEYGFDGEWQKALFWWDSKLKRDIVEIPLDSEMKQERFVKAAQTAEGKQGWRNWAVEEEEGRLRIVCEYQRLIKYPRKTDPQKRATLIFAHLGIYPLEIKKAPIMVKSRN